MIWEGHAYDRGAFLRSCSPTPEPGRLTVVWTNQQPDRNTPRAPTRCEFTVSGALGPVLMHACRPEEDPMAQACTIIHAEMPHGWDVADVVGLLESRGVQLDAVTVVAV